MFRAVEKVRERLLRATSLLDQAGITYAVVGGNAVASWVSTIDEAAVRFTQDVDIMIRREDLPLATKAMETGGFIYRHSASIDMFLDGPKAKARDAVHILFSGEKVKKTDEIAAPSVTESYRTPRFQVINLEALVRMKLLANRDKDRTHIRDMIGVGLIDATWPERFPPILADRLKEILANPEG
jgi:hypothetical protein